MTNTLQTDNAHGQCVHRNGTGRINGTARRQHSQQADRKAGQIAVSHASSGRHRELQRNYCGGRDAAAEEMVAIKLVLKSRTGRELLPDGLLVPADVSGIDLPLSPTSFATRLGNSLITVLSLRPQATVDDLKARFAELKPRYYPSRQRFTLPVREGQRSGEALASGKKLSDYGLQDGSVLLFKDLGPQVLLSWLAGAGKLPARCTLPPCLWLRRLLITAPAAYHPQIGYATVFFWEYFGPLVVYPLFYFLPHLLYPGVK